MNEKQEEALFAFLGLLVKTNQEMEAFDALADAFDRNVLEPQEVAYVEAIEANAPPEPEEPAEDEDEGE